MSADPLVVEVRADDHGCSVPTDERADTPLHELVAREVRLVFRRDRVHIWARDGRREPDTQLACALEQADQQVAGPSFSAFANCPIEGRDPIVGLSRIDIWNLMTETIDDRHDSPG
jgi:hypothetical protein